MACAASCRRPLPSIGHQARIYDIGEEAVRGISTPVRVCEYRPSRIRSLSDFSCSRLDSGRSPLGSFLTEVLGSAASPTSASSRKLTPCPYEKLVRWPITGLCAPPQNSRDYAARSTCMSISLRNVEATRQGGTIELAKVHLAKCQYPIQRPPYRDHFAKRPPSSSPQLNSVNS